MSSRSATGAALLLTTAVVLASGCAGPGEGALLDAAFALAADGGVDGRSGDTASVPDALDPAVPVPPEPPAPARRPDLTDWLCPPGWVATTVLEGTPEEHRTCDLPAPATSCGPGTFAVVGSSGCQPLGDPCPAGDFAERIPAGSKVVYVQRGASGDGSSPAAPLGSLAAALSSAPDGAVIALARGTYVETAVIDRPLTLLGACASDTRLEARVASDDDAVLEITSPAEVTVRNLTIGGDRRGLSVRTDAVARVSGVLVDSARLQGIITDPGTRTTLTDVLVRDTRAAADGAAGQGLFVDGGFLSARRTTVERSRRAGVVVIGAAEVELERLAVQGTEAASDDDTVGDGLFVSEGSRLRGRQVLLLGNRDAGLWVGDPGTTANLSDLVVRGTREMASDGRRGAGMVLIDGARAAVNRAVLDANHVAGIDVFGGTAEQKSQLSLSQALIRGTLPEVAGGQFGHGIGINDESSVVVDRVVLTANRAYGTFVLGSGAGLQMSDTVVHATESNQTTTSAGHGLVVADGASARVERVLLDGNRTAGLEISPYQTDDSGTVEATDLVVTATREREDDQLGGDGIFVSQGQLTLTRAHLEGNRSSGLSFTRAAVGLLADVTIVDTQISPALDTAGRGMEIGHSSRVQLVRADLARNHDIGIAVLGDGADPTPAVLEGSDIRVTDTQPGGDDNGNGLVAQEGVQVRLARAVFERNSEIGISAGYGVDAVTHQPNPFTIVSELVLTDTVIRDTGPRADGNWGVGLHLQYGVLARLERALIENNRQVGIQVVNSRSWPVRATLRDIVVRGTQPRLSDGLFGDGITIQNTGRLQRVELDRVRLERNRRAGLSTFFGTASMREVVFECNGLVMAFERQDEHRAQKALDLGGNRCGCEGTPVPCHAVSSDLSAPPAVSQ